MTQQFGGNDSPLVWLDWPAPRSVKACYSLRPGGVSTSPYASFNVAAHVGDDPVAVERNRRQLTTMIKQENIYWLQQVHGREVVELSCEQNHVADASWSRQINQVCCVMTADCLPVFFCDKQASQVAVAHGGWRGLYRGVLQATLNTFPNPDDVLVYFGPAISQQAFEVGNDVRDAFLENAILAPSMKEHFLPGIQNGKWMADLYGIAETLLRAEGVVDVYGGNRCTFTEEDYFFSYRRDNQTGRMAHLIWLE